MKWIYICSPLRGDYEANTAAAIRYCREVALVRANLPEWCGAEIRTMEELEKVVAV